MRKENGEREKEKEKGEKEREIERETTEARHFVTAAKMRTR